LLAAVMKGMGSYTTNSDGKNVANVVLPDATRNMEMDGVGFLSHFAQTLTLST
jgi:hypothetical protein